MSPRPLLLAPTTDFLSLDHPSFLEKFEKGDAYGKKKFAKALLEGNSTLEAVVVERLNEFLNELKESGENGAPLKIEQAAKSAGLGNVYDTMYRVLSNDAAHPSLIALKPHLRVRSSMICGTSAK